MNWETIYRKKVADVETVLNVIESGNRLYIGGGAGVPIALTQGLTKYASRFNNLELVHILTFADAPYVSSKYQDNFRVNALFIGQNVRPAVQDGQSEANDY